MTTLKRKSWFIIGAVFALSLALTPSMGSHAQAETPIVRGYLFFSETCAGCDELRSQVVPLLYRQFERRLQLVAIDVDAQEANRQWLLDCRAAYGVAQDERDLPTLFIGDQYIVGSEAIEAELPSLVDAYMATGGTDYPDVPRPGGPLKPTVQFMFFFSPTCPHCEEVKENVLPQIQSEYGSQVQWEALDTSDDTNYRALLILGDAVRVPQDAMGSVPVVFIGDEYSAFAYLLGGDNIEQNLEPTIEWLLAIGGAGLPGFKEELFRLASTPFPEPTPLATQGASPSTTPAPPSPTPDPSSSSTGTPSGSDPPIHLAYFEETGCSECDGVSNALAHLQDRYPNLIIHRFNIIDDLATNLCLCEAADVPDSQRHDAPAIFVGSDYLVGGNIQYDKLIELVSQYANTGAEPTWEKCDETQIELPPPPPWWAVILPGLADGINPCAFATIIFFVSYLSIIKRRGRDVILVGLSFTLAVFLSYLGFGMLLREILAGLIGWVGPVLRPILNGVTAILCIVLAVLSFGDFRKARRGNAKDMTLQLPHRLRMWINKTIRKSMKSETLVTASFVSGVVVSFIELACTGQVYVPIIQGLSNPTYRAQSTLDLLVYCLAFVTPLIVVFVLSYMGTSSKQLTEFFTQYSATVKLVMALLFLGIGIWLVYDILHVWGVFSPLLASAVSSGTT